MNLGDPLPISLDNDPEPIEPAPILNGGSPKLFRCGHPKVTANIYTVPSNRKLVCRACKKSYNVRTWREVTKDRMTEERSEYIRLFKYRCSITQYAALLEKQLGVCAGCGRPPVARRKRNGELGIPKLEIDHDHNCCKGEQSCGKCIRGLLCHRCNATLGNADDSPERLRTLAAYLERFI